MPRECPSNCTDVPPLPSGVLTLQVVSVECQKDRDFQVWHGSSDFPREGSGVQSGRTTC